jgi:hypothetical protein
LIWKAWRSSTLTAGAEVGARRGVAAREPVDRLLAHRFVHADRVIPNQQLPGKISRLLVHAGNHCASPPKRPDRPDTAADRTALAATTHPRYKAAQIPEHREQEER